MTVAQLSAGLADGTMTSRSIVEEHLARIAALDGAFHAVRCLAPDAIEAADASDRIRATSGPRSPIEGIPVLIKDNVDVAGLPTTAGALALEHSVPVSDAPLVARLREAGAIILGKTNLSELANFLTEGMPSGYSALGGQVLNPYDTSITPSGSSSGSGAAAALGFAPLTIGTETDGSITSPADHQSLVGFKPTVGLVSRTGVVPIAASQDTAGPMTRTVADAALLLAAIAGPDPEDPATAEAAGPAAEIAGLTLDADALRGVRLGVVRGTFPDDEKPDEQQLACFEEALAALRDAGALLEDVVLPEIGIDDETLVLHYEFALGVDAYLARLGDAAPVRTLAEIGDWNRAHAAAALKFGQDHVEAAVAIDHDARRAEYSAARSRDVDVTSTGMLAAMGERREALVFPGATGCGWASRAGWPSVVVPAGYTERGRRPVGILLTSRPWSDARLLNFAYALEQAHPIRRPPSEINPAAFR